MERRVSATTPGRHYDRLLPGRVRVSSAERNDIVNALTGQQLNAIADLCRRFRVRGLALFGSAVRDDFDPRRSDFDFLVEFESQPPGEHADSYFGLLQELESLLGRPIDLVESAMLRNPYRRQEIEATQVVLHAAA